LHIAVGVADGAIERADGVRNNAPRVSVAVKCVADGIRMLRPDAATATDAAVLPSGSRIGAI